MSVKIQNIKTRKTYEIDNEAKLYYHYLDPLEQKRLLFSYMPKGKIDQDHIFEMAYDFMGIMITGWKGFIDDNNKPIVFKKELIKTIPLEIAIDFVIKTVMPSFKGLIKSAEKIMPKDKDGKPIKIKQTLEGN